MCAGVACRVSAGMCLLVVVMLLGVATCLVSPVAEGVTPYILTDLGTLGGWGSAAEDINDLGQVVGWADGPQGRHAFLWDSGVMTDLGSLTSYESGAFGVNDLGQVVGRFYTSYDEYRAFLWEDGVMTDLGTLGGDMSLANDINNSGQIVGWAKNASGYVRAFLYEDGHMQDLGLLEGNRSQAWGINDAGQIVGDSRRAVLWDEGVMHDLGTLGGDSSSASDINEHGQIVGYSDPGSGYFQSFIWENGRMRRLGVGGLYGAAFSINDSGQVVGYISTSTQGTYRYYLWEDGDTYWIEDLIVGGATCYEILSVGGINNRGQIVGSFMGPGLDEHAFVLTPIPEPGALAVAALGVLALLLRRRTK